MKVLCAFVFSCVAASVGATEPVAAELSKRFPSEDAELLSRVAAAAVAQAADDEGVSIGALAKDYSVTCPLGWADAGDGSKCLAPFGYQGPCGDSVQFGGLAPHQKEALAHDCGAAFAVAGSCAADFSQACPEGWFDKGDAGCEAPSSYTGRCVRSKDFSRISAGGKALFADACGVTWPCHGTVAIKLAEDSLSKSCGPKCLSMFRSHGPAIALPDALGQVAAHAERSTSAARQWLDVSSSAISGGSPCATPAACAIKSLGVNRCNFARAALQKTYEELNTATHVLGTAVSSLCGCVRVGDVSSCLLKSMPAACAFPYEVYSKAFSTSVSVWEAVKASSVKCAVHVDPAIAP
jgi:CPW-WPC domain-containing protein